MQGIGARTSCCSNVFRAHRQAQSDSKLSKILGWKAVYDKPCIIGKSADLENIRDSGCLSFNASRTDISRSTRILASIVTPQS